jgi:hypothetical protein
MMAQEFAEGQKVGVLIPNQQHKCYEFTLATIKEFDGTTWRQNEDWYTVVLDSGEETRVRGEKIVKRMVLTP